MKAGDLLGYEGKRTVITGSASGMGQAAAQLLVDLGAEVYALDVKETAVPVTKSIQTDLKDKESINAAIKQIPGDIHSLFECAGIPGFPTFSNFDTTMVNFVGHRYLAESLIPRMKEGGAIAIISSFGGMGWKKNMETVKELMETDGFDEAKAWLEANEERNTGYILSKQCLIFYTHARAGDLAKRNIRINCIGPIATDTPMIRHFEELTSKEFMREYFCAPCDRYATPQEMAEPLVFLNSNMARFVSGQNLLVDYGYWGEVEAGQREYLVG